MQNSPASATRQTKIDCAYSRPRYLRRKNASPVGATLIANIPPMCVSERAPVSNQGFTLIEIIVGMVISAISLTMLYSLIYPQIVRSVEPMLQIRAAELGQAMVEEILAKPYDENSPTGGVPPCSSCTVAADFGVDSGESTRADFDDVDDFHHYCGFPQAVDQIAGITPSGFDNFRMEVCVIYDGNYDAVADANQNAKRITVSVYAPTRGSGFAPPIRFSAYRGNF